MLERKEVEVAVAKALEAQEDRGVDPSHQGAAVSDFIHW